MGGGASKGGAADGGGGGGDNGLKEEMLQGQLELLRKERDELKVKSQLGKTRREAGRPPARDGARPPGG